MEIKSIKQIKQIGIFSDFSDGGSKRFEKLTLLYGLNAHGKTTLCDIFQSLAENKGNIIENRKTIPNSLASQLVELSVKKGEMEQTIRFKKKQWDDNDFGKNIKIFGTDFIHKNVFTGLTIGRQNRENFTDFILGEEDTTKAKKLEEIKRELRNSNLKNVIPLFVKNKSEQEINDFINLKVTENPEDLKTALSEKNAELIKEQKNLKNAEQILSKRELPGFQKNNLRSIISCIKFINTILLKSFESIKEDAISKLNDHIKLNFTNQEMGEKWINDGLKISKYENKDANCPFCGQNLSNVKDLIETYQAYFNEEYSQYIEKIETELDNSLRKLRNRKIEFSKYLSDLLLIIKDYQGLISKDSFRLNITSFERIKEAISEKENEIKSEISKIISKFEQLIDSKKRKPHKKSNIVDYSTFKQLINDIEQKEIGIEKLHSDFIKKINELKDGYRTNRKKEYVQKLKKDIEIIEKKIKRLEQDSQCKNYQKLKQKINDLSDRKKRLSNEIEKSQSEYLDKYFKEINKLFKQLGSNDFSLNKNTDNRGNKKVYSLSVKYKNQRITNEQLPVVFSESDRRALALAIFWSKININDDKTLKKMILVFDDPATSFDDNRITKTINLLKSTLSKVNQIIVLTHYVNFIKRFLEITKRQQLTYKLLEIRKENLTSKINELNENKFILDEHNRKFLIIYDFINRKNHNDIKSDLRPYLENQLKRIFYKQIIDFDIDKNNLENLIDGLKNKNVITDSQKKKLHEFRKTLNPDNHNFTSNNDEDVRSFAKEMIEYLHSFNFTSNFMLSKKESNEY